MSKLILLLSLTFSLHIHAQTQPRYAQAAANIDELLEAHNLANEPGLVVSVMKNGEVVYQKGVGTANLEYDVLISPSTVFQVASVSKQFTVFSVLLLEQDGKLSIDDDIRKYLPELPDYGHKISLRHLANHTSGIRDNTDLANMIGVSEADLLSNDDLLALLMRQKGLNFVPGNQFEYCNSGYVLLAEIVKRVSGMSFAAFTQERIFKPLNMKNSQFIDDPEVIVKNRAYSYYKFDNILYKSILNHSFVGSTGLNTNAEDLSLWAMNFEKQTVGNDQIFNKMRTKSKLNNGKEIPYGLGLETKEYNGLDVFFHGGGIGKYGSYVLHIPKHQFSVVFMCNSHDFHPYDFVYPIIDEFLSEEIELPAPSNYESSKPYSNFVGDYEIFPGYIVTISAANDSLFLQTKGDPNKLYLPERDERSFNFPAMPHSRIKFEKSDGKSSNRFSWQMADFFYFGERIKLEPFDVSNVDYQELLGTYYSTELNDSYQLILQDGQLVATHPLNQPILLSPLQVDVFNSGSSFFGKVEIIRDKRKKVIGMYVSGQKVKRLQFDKIPTKKK